MKKEHLKFLEELFDIAFKRDVKSCAESIKILIRDLEQFKIRLRLDNIDSSMVEDQINWCKQKQFLISKLI